MKTGQKKVEGGEKRRSEWIRELIGDAIDTLDPPDQTIPQTLIPFDYLLMARNKLRTNVRDVARKFINERPILKDAITRRRGIVKTHSQVDYLIEPQEADKEESDEG